MSKSNSDADATSEAQIKHSESLFSEFVIHLKDKIFCDVQLFFQEHSFQVFSPHKARI